MSTENNNNQVAKQEQSIYEKWVAAIQKAIGGRQIPEKQQRLAYNYFIKLDIIIKDSEQRRLSTNERYRDPLPITWGTINFDKLANDTIIFSGVGLDPNQPNHLNPIPYKDKSGKFYNMGFIMGYAGLELKAKKYGFEVPDQVVVELVYQNDIYKVFKKDMNNKIEHYKFEVVNAFDRGDIIGGFYAHLFYSNPEKNKVVEFTKKDIDKRKPKTASAEFWGGEKAIWKNGQKTDEVEQVEGWYEEMAEKTLKRAAYNAIIIDSDKIDDNYIEMILRESEYNDNVVEHEIAANANKTPLVIEKGPADANADVQNPVVINTVIPPAPEKVPVTETAPVGNGTAQELFSETSNSNGLRF